MNRLIIIPIPLINFLWSYNLSLAFPFSVLPNSLKNHSLLISKPSFSMFQALFVKSLVFRSIIKFISAISLEFTLIPISYVSITICILDFALTIEIVIRKHPLILEFVETFISRITTFMAITETTLVLRNRLECLMALTMRHIRFPISLI